MRSCCRRPLPCAHDLLGFHVLPWLVLLLLWALFAYGADLVARRDLRGFVTTPSGLVLLAIAAVAIAATWWALAW